MDANKLSTNQENVLRLIALGYTKKEIASELDISLETLETLKVSAMEKLNLCNRIDVVRFAISQDWREG
jgi:DNA-binding NarL/FixJ family response regulator